MSSDHPPVILQVMTERERQEHLWGEQNHAPCRWFAILTEEFAEVAQEVNKCTFNDAPSKVDLFNLRTELIQLSAVAIAFVECLDRNELRGDL